MTNPFRCSCGYESPTPVASGVCPRCQKSPGASASYTSATLVEDAPAQYQESGRSTRTIPPMPKTIDGFQITSQLGMGGMGSVYLAYEPLLDREVALKVLASSPVEEVQAKRSVRFLAEAILTGKLAHSGIIPIYHVGHDPAHGYYYTMRYIKGRTLADIIHGGGDEEPISLVRRLTFFLRASEAVAFAHRHGVLHRDLKPANIMVTDFGEVLVLDWGLAKYANQPDEAAASGSGPQRSDEYRRRHDTSTQLFLARQSKPANSGSYLRRMQVVRPGSSTVNKGITQHAQVLGTPGYLAPEQGAGLPVCCGSDVYSLGATLYEILTRALPVAGADGNEMVLNTITGKTIPLASRPEAARLPRALCEIVSRALAAEPENRYCDAGEMAQDLSLYLEGRCAWKRIAEEKFEGELSHNWQVASGAIGMDEKIVTIAAGTRLRCLQTSLGDCRGELEFWADGASRQWDFNVCLRELDEKGEEPRYRFRMGVVSRPFVELLRAGKCVQRRLDVRLQANQRCALKFEMENDVLRLWLGGRRVIEYREVFPQTGAQVELDVQLGQVQVHGFVLSSRGAPLHLSFSMLPDRFYRMKRFSEARELYRQLSASHPDREEGLLARFKAGLCSTLLGDTQDAFTEFTRLEGTMLDHCCALGLAEIGVLDHNIDWAWEALKNGYRRHQEPLIRNELWFALLSLIETLEANQADAKIGRYRELIRDLAPEASETGRIGCEILDLSEQAQGNAGLRAAAARLLEEFPQHMVLVQEALFGLSRAGLDEKSVPPALKALEQALRERWPDATLARFHILHAEACLAQGQHEAANQHLRQAAVFGGTSGDVLWARGWQILIQCVSGQYQQAVTETHEVLARLKRSSPTYLGHFRLLEGLAYLGKRQPGNAVAAFRTAATYDSVWGRAAGHWVERRPACELAAFPKDNSSEAQLLEAAFLVGEAHRLANQQGLAQDHFAFCTDKSRERAMISRLIQERRTS